MFEKLRELKLNITMSAVLMVVLGKDCRYQAQIKRQGAKKAAKRAAEKGQTVPLPTERNEEISAAQDAAEEKSA